MTNVILTSAVTGVATLASAYALQKLYAKTNFHPPDPVFWFFIGVTAQVGLGVGNQLWNKLSASSLPALSGFGETLPELETMIETYQKHIADLNKIVVAGSSAGKQQAQQKIAQEQTVLDDLLSKREDMLSD